MRKTSSPSTIFWRARLKRAARGTATRFCPLHEDLRRQLSWRPPSELSDWTLQVGSKKYSVHKAIVGAGERRSVTLQHAFEHHGNPLLAGSGGVGGPTSTTHLSSGDSPYVPTSCERYFETVLDFMYTGKLELTIESVVH
eukprot:6802614-Prymnesium_polylepis.1